MEHPAGATAPRRRHTPHLPPRRVRHQDGSASRPRQGARALLTIPEADDPDGRTRIGDLLETVASQKEPIPDYDETARRFRSGQSLTARLTVGDWLDQWLAGKRTRDNTNRTYESHVRVHLKPRIGHVRLDRLHISHLTEMFDAIKDENEVIRSENAERHLQVERCKWRGKGRPPSANAWPPSAPSSPR